MQNMKAMKMATGMLVAVLLLSSLAVLPSTTVNAAVASNAIISFNVVDSAGNPIQGAVATLTEVHTSVKYKGTSDAGGLIQFSGTGTNPVLPGYYLLNVTRPGVFSDVEFPTVIKFDGTGPVALGIIVIPASTGTLSLTVTQAVGGSPASGVVVKVYDINSQSKNLRTLPTFTGSSSVSLFPGTYKVIVTANGLELEVRTVTITASTTTLVSVSMNPSVPLLGFVFKNGVPPTGVTAFLVNTNTGLDMDKRIVAARIIGTNGFVFDGYAGTFFLMVDATDGMASMQTITLPSTPSTITVNLTTPVGQIDRQDIAYYASSWNNFNLTRNLAMGFDVSWANVAYAFLPNLRMQIDFAYGNGDGLVSTTELNQFRSRVTAFGPQNATSDFVIRVNGTSYVVQTDFTAVTLNNLANTGVDSVQPWTAALTTLYHSQSALTSTLSQYAVDVYAKYDSPSVDFKTAVTWPTGYEMVSNTTQGANTKVTGFTTVLFDAGIRTTGTATFDKVSTVVQVSQPPTAAAGIDSSNFAYPVTATNGTVLYYIVSTSKDIVFTANGSADPNRNPLTFTWTFGDGQTATTGSFTVKHQYSAVSLDITVRLRATDVAGKFAETTFKVKADGIVPVPSISVLNKTISSGLLTVNQNEAVVYNGTSSFDRIASTTDTSAANKGIIKTWTWVWGDGNTTTVSVGMNNNVTKTYARAGTYTLMLNVTDAAGHVATQSIQVLVKDTVPPEVSFVILKNGADAKGTAVENETLWFSANATKDTNDSFSSLNFTWSFGDGTAIEYGNYVNHTYQVIKTVTVKLTVKDLAGNSANTTKSLTITSQARPDLRVVSVKFSPATFTEGESGSIIVNISNVGNLDATLPDVTYYVINGDGSQSQIDQSSVLLINGTTPNNVLKPGQWGTITGHWSPPGKGNYTIKVVAHVSDEISTGDNVDSAAVNVNEASWKALALYGGIFAVIIIVIVLYYFRRRLPKLGGKKTEKKAETPKGGKK
jgi:hypothetical protein